MKTRKPRTIMCQRNLDENEETMGREDNDQGNQKP